MKRVMGAMLVVAACAAGGVAQAVETLRAAEVLCATNVDWLALARAQQKVRAGTDVHFVWQTRAEASYAAIRRAMWIAALYGIKTQTCSDERTSALLNDEFKAVQNRLKEPFAFDFAVRESPDAVPLVPLLLGVQANFLLIGENEKDPMPTILACDGEQVSVERTGVSFQTHAMAANSMLSHDADKGHVLEKDGQIARDVFIRRYEDKSATVINMTDRARPDLIFRRGLSRIKFDLPPDGVVQMTGAEPFRMSHASAETFISNLWQVEFEGGLPTRVVGPNLLQTVAGESYRGDIRYTAHVSVPRGERLLLLHIDCADTEAELFVGTNSQGIRAWEPYEWEMPLNSRGRNVPVTIRVTKRKRHDCLQSAPCWHTR